MNPVAIIVLVHAMQSDLGRQAEQRIKQAQYRAAVEARAQRREIERAQPASHLTLYQNRSIDVPFDDRLRAKLHTVLRTLREADGLDESPPVSRESRQMRRVWVR